MNLENYSSNFSIAWFKLYESALRNEHDRAMTNYKLLIHSYRSPGFKKQILGDLYLSLGEKDKAEIAYTEAFYSYVESVNIFDAAKILVMMKYQKLNIEAKYLVISEELQKEKKNYTLLIEELENKVKSLL